MRKIDIPVKSAMVITDRITRKYLTKVDIAEGVLVVCDGMTTLTDARYFSAAKNTLENVGVNAVLYKGFETLKSFLKSLNINTLLVDYTTTTVKEYNEYFSLGYKVKDCSKILNESIAIKTPVELEKIKKACEITQKAYHTAIKQVKLGMTEIELKEIIENLYFELGADGVAFDTMVAFGANGAVPHHETGQTKLSNDTPILIDMGCTVDGFCSDLTRTAFFGTPSERFLTCYNAVLNANLLAEQKISVGMSARQADAIARNHLKEYKLDKYFTHSLGHGLGLNIHEYPTLSKKRGYKLKKDTVFTVEPGVYLDGEFGIRIEDSVLLTETGVERLFDDDKKLIIL